MAKAVVTSDKTFGDNREIVFKITISNEDYYGSFVMGKDTSVDRMDQEIVRMANEIKNNLNKTNTSVGSIVNRQVEIG